MQVDEKESTITPIEPVSEPLTSCIPNAVQPGEEEDADSPDGIFFRAVIEIPTQPLPRFTPQWELQRSLERHGIFMMLLVVLSLLATAILNVINQPVVTVTLLPMHKFMQLTTAIPIQTRQLAPVTLTRTQDRLQEP